VKDGPDSIVRGAQLCKGRKAGAAFFVVLQTKKAKAGRPSVEVKKRPVAHR
jgi:hypothetical protein